MYNIRMNKLVVKTSFITAAIVSVYLLVSLAGLFQVAPTAHHMHMRDCPYVIGEQSLCSMNLFDRMGELKVFSTAIVPFYAWLVLMAGLAAVILWRFFPHQVAFVTAISLLASPPSEPLHQTLFSSGILHPKAP